MIHPWELDDGALLPTFNYDYADARDPRMGGIVWLNESTTTTVPTDDRWTTQTLCPSQWLVGCVGSRFREYRHRRHIVVSCPLCRQEKA